MTRHRIQAVGAGFLLLALLASPANAQFSRSAGGKSGDAGRTAVPRESASGGETRGLKESRVEAQAERPAAREPSRPRSGEQGRSSREPRRQEPESQGRHHDQDAGDGWRDNDWGRGRHDDVDPTPGGLVINPILVRGVSVAGQSISPPTLIGRRVVIGQTRIDSQLNIDPHPRKSRKTYPSTVVYVAPGIAYETEPVDSDVYVDDTSDVVTASPEPRAAMPAAPSLASLGSYYSFNPWYSLTDRITAGYPVAYPDRFVVTYEQVGLRPGADLGNAGELPPAAVMALEAGLQIIPYATGTFGGLSFQIEPQDAEIYVDDVFVGLLEDYPAHDAPLPLLAGTHRVELRATGYRVEAFDVIVVRGQVTPLSGRLLRRAR